MIKLRLHGTESEIQNFQKIINLLESYSLIEVLSESELYKDRGSSKYSRKYIDVEQKCEGGKIMKNVFVLQTNDKDFKEAISNFL